MTAIDKKAARKAANIAAAAERLKRLQAADKKRLEEKATRIANFFAAQAEQKAAAEKAAAEAKFVEDSLAGPSGLALNRWLKGRLPTFDRVSRFFAERPNLKRGLAHAA